MIENIEYVIKYKFLDKWTITRRYSINEYSDLKQTALSELFDFKTKFPKGSFKLFKQTLIEEEIL